RVTYEIGPDDLRHYTDDRPFSALSIPTPDGQKHLGSKGTGAVEDVVVACIGTAYIPVAGKFTDTQWYGDLKLLYVNVYQRSEIAIHPDFTGTDAFISDLPEGARLTNMDDQTSGVMYGWRGGKVVTAGAQFGGSPPVGWWESRSALSQYLLAGLGL